MASRLLTTCFVGLAASSAAGQGASALRGGQRRLSQQCTPLPCSGYRLIGNMELSPGADMRSVGSVVEFSIRYTIGPRPGLSAAAAARKGLACPIHDVHFEWKWFKLGSTPHNAEEDLPWQAAMPWGGATDGALPLPTVLTNAPTPAPTPAALRPVWFGEIDDGLLDPRCKQVGMDGLVCQLGTIAMGGSVDLTVAVRIDKQASEATSVPAWSYRAWDKAGSGGFCL